MSTKRCYYETLEVDRNADESKLKAAFRKLAMKWHPDKNPGDATSEVRFKEINEAYEVLKDGDKRAAYDRFGHAAFEQGAGGGGPGFGAGFAAADASAVRTCATTWKSRSRTPTSARPRRSRFRFR
jgi:molecular chaperone DnaJ